MATSRKVPIYCYQCVSGPDLMTVEVEDGIAKRIESNYAVKGEHPGGGRVCVKAYGIVQKTYNPNRIKQPMKRTNPRKGRDEDPGFVPISWDEALDLVADKLRQVRARGMLNDEGVPRVAVTTGGGGTPVQYMGTFPAFMAAWGPIDGGYGAGQGVKCYHSEHLYGELWHRAFIVSPDVPYVNYVINCGNNVEASAGVVGIWREADARVRGAKRVQVEPHLSVTGALSAEWVPIKPKTDAAFLFGLINHILHQRNWRDVCDLPFLKNLTSSPYLVGPNGWYLRDASGRPLVWDLADGRAKAHDADDLVDPALEGEFTLAGVEHGADEARFAHEAAIGRPAFQLLMAHMKDYTPDWAASQCEVPADSIRRVADEYLAHACVGETIEVDGQSLPFRPVSVLLGKGVNNGWGGYHCCWARTVLAVLVGALEVPGGTLGTTVKLVRPATSRVGSVKPHGVDGLMSYQFNETSREGWSKQPSIRNAYKTLVPLSSDSPWSAALGPAHLPWLFQKKAPDNWPRTVAPDVWFCYRSNPAISSWNAPQVAERLTEFPFIVSFAYTDDETNHFADVLLPEALDLESLQIIRVGSTKMMQQFWKHEGWAVRQPAIESPCDTMDFTDISTELARRVGILDEYVKAINRGAAGIGLVDRKGTYDYSLDPTVAPKCEDVWNAFAKAASHNLTNGEEVRDLAWFKENGYLLRPFPQINWYLYPALTSQRLRFEMPYQERIMRHGQELANRMHEAGIDWWEHQLKEYEPLPTYESFPDIWVEYAREYGRDPDEFPFWALTARSMQYAWGANVGLPMINEVANNIAGHRGVIINRSRARELGIAEGERIIMESVSGTTEGEAVLREGIRPDTVLMIGQFAHWKTPFAKDLNLPSLNSLTDLSLKLTDGTGSSADIMRIRLRRASSGELLGAKKGAPA
ncbi:molybdopterin-dependent oxidoreductase [Lacisediminimonas sp.]|uniref:molybdopterin-dependent oxidoreductase n=1 Tax=Lacisediminimonas sp. TaxID=3060582 RepID=UPI0027159FCF|nr:molybdopterin-dependent oxidoreductase [Lacisediminimonas sp.]MDO8300206.1 molybdopterin-dependent oxidoreductase [Lacisediminimonas sp.]